VITGWRRSVDSQPRVALRAACNVQKRKLQGFLRSSAKIDYADCSE
jgi:hypothetical protein